MKTVYFISGLGADHRAFELLDLSFCTPVHLPWIKPLQNETIEHYAGRFAASITGNDPIIVGLSFGGMLTMEIAKHRPIGQAIIVSSAKISKEIPFYLRLMRWLPLHRVVKPQTIKKLNHLAYKLMGIHGRKDKIIFMQMLHDADNQFLRWAINAIIHWKNKYIPPNTVHIHGRHDILLPHRFVNADLSIDKGRHLMPMIQPALVSSLLRKLIAD